MDKPTDVQKWKTQYAEIVTTNVDLVCAAYSQVHGTTLSESDPALGGARTTRLVDGGLIGIRAPMHEAELPVVLPYSLVEDIEASVVAAVEAGAETALPPTELAGHGWCVFEAGRCSLGAVAGLMIKK